MSHAIHDELVALTAEFTALRSSGNKKWFLSITSTTNFSSMIKKKNSIIHLSSSISIWFNS